MVSNMGSDMGISALIYGFRSDLDAGDLRVAEIWSGVELMDGTERGDVQGDRWKLKCGLHTLVSVLLRGTVCRSARSWAVSRSYLCREGTLVESRAAAVGGRHWSAVVVVAKGNVWWWAGMTAGKVCQVKRVRGCIC